MPNFQSEKVFKMNYYSFSLTKHILFYFFSVITAGIIFMVFYWFPRLDIWLYTLVETIDEADHICIVKIDDTSRIIEILRKSVRMLPSTPPSFIPHVWFENQLFYYEENSQTFKTVGHLMEDHLNNNPQNFMDCMNGLTPEQVEELHNFYGKNVIKIENQSFFKFFAVDFFTPIVIWQLFTMVCFFFIGYRYYSAAMIVVIFISITIVSIKKMKSHTKIRSIAELITEVRVIRNENNVLREFVISSENLVVGDIVLVQKGEYFTVDLVMAHGSCVVSEAVITGESNPVRKSGVFYDKTTISDPKIQESNYIHCGSNCVLTKAKEVKAIVVRTGWCTSKGQLISDIINSVPVEFKFKNDINKVMLGLFLFGIGFCLIYLFIALRSVDFSLKKYTFKCIELMTIVLPTSLIISFSFGISEANDKLMEKNILPVIIDKINEAGRVKFVCFDKTGTLTETNVRVAGHVVRISNEPEDFDIVPDEKALAQYDMHRHTIELMGCCHSLQTVAGLVSGDPLDEEMFKSSQFVLDEFENGQEFKRYIIPERDYRIRYNLEPTFRFEICSIQEFSTERKRMSVLVTDNYSKNFRTLIKGAPEQIKLDANPETIPPNYDALVTEYSQKGYRLLSLGFKDFQEKDLSKIDPTQIEKNFNFIGFLLMNNPIKPETKDVINSLKKVDIECKMITGDNIYTSLNVACASGLLEPFENIFLGVYSIKTDSIKYIFFTHQELKTQLTVADLHLSKIPGSFRAIDNLSKRSIRVKMSFNSILEVLVKCKEIPNTKIAMEGIVYEKELLRVAEFGEGFVNELFGYTIIFARSNPTQKEMIVEKLKNTETCKKNTYCVAFVGDGSNDSKALRIANVGLSLGTNESSIASSFNTKILNIGPIVSLLVEGKGCLDMGVQTFKFIMIASLLQFITVDALSIGDYDFNSFELFLSDFLSIAIPAILMCSTKSVDELNKNIPRVSILNFQFMVSFVFQLFFFVVFLLSFLYKMISNRFNKSASEILNTKEYFFQDDFNFTQGLYVTFFLNMFVWFFCVAINTGYPYRKPIYTNLSMTIFMFALLLLYFLVIFEYDMNIWWWSYFLVKYCNVTHLEYNLRNNCVFFSIICGVFSYFLENIINHYFLVKKRILNEIVKREKDKIPLSSSLLDEKNFILETISRN